MTTSEAARDDLRRELRATVAARSEIGAEYDDHLIESFIEKIDQRLAHDQQVRHMTQAARLSAGQRLALAIVSLALFVPAGIPILAMAGLSGLGIFAVAVVLVNGLAAR